MASKFQQFLTDNQLDTRRLLIASQHVESLQPEDRAARLAKRQGVKPEGEEKPAKRRSGRPVTPRLLAQALAGKPVTGPAKTRLLRAVNRLLEQKKKDPADLRKLF
ncbi:MAG: hypothetical protein HS104_17605 [Polyangiaceae bacterium]|nr:hypothetical protein [Polyangiaceae bacterium]MBK9001309.1 hypothetical protein [Myxococcales bacterium]MCE7889335.1 hypothetical protein [Sorangiineae bacterium PRO1]MCL4752187.1 hypothetical protein [Myxococcales bacterium]